MLHQAINFLQTADEIPTAEDKAKFISFVEAIKKDTHSWPVEAQDGLEALLMFACEAAKPEYARILIENFRVDPGSFKCKILHEDHGILSKTLLSYSQTLDKGKRLFPLSMEDEYQRDRMAEVVDLLLQNGAMETEAHYAQSYRQAVCLNRGEIDVYWKRDSGFLIEAKRVLDREAGLSEKVKIFAQAAKGLFSYKPFAEPLTAINEHALRKIIRLAPEITPS